MAANAQKSRTWVQNTLEFRLRMSERLVRASISSSFNRNASVFEGAALTLTRQFLLPPMSLLSNLNQISVSRNAYDKYWPDESARTISDAEALQNLLDSGNALSATLVLLAHQAYDHLGWVGWAHLMRNMSDDSSFGIAYMYPSHCIPPCTYSSQSSADYDVKCGRDRSVYGAHGLDYIIALPNPSLQAYAAYLSQSNSKRYDSQPSLNFASH
jgi:hypothetical protein